VICAECGTVYCKDCTAGSHLFIKDKDKIVITDGGVSATPLVNLGN